MRRIGRYEVLRHLASGGMGHVYLARATGPGGFERLVVIKALEPDLGDDDPRVAMFLDEARLVGALHHQHIVPVYEVGRDEAGGYFLAMDYVPGETAEAVWQRARDRASAIRLGCALTVTAAVASALHYAHNSCARDGSSLGIVHRDVSLSNVMVGYDGAVKLIDFGIAKAAERATKTDGGLKGTIGYLAPEQILGKPVDHRADVFALGIVLYELTTMTRAFRDPSDFTTLERITRGDITPPSRRVDGYPRALEAIVVRALRVDPAERFHDAGAMGRAIEAVGRRVGLVLGRVEITGVMTHLFGPLAETARLRWPRASTKELVPDPPAVPIAIEPDPTQRTPAAIGSLDDTSALETTAVHAASEVTTETFAIDFAPEGRSMSAGPVDCPVAQTPMDFQPRAIVARGPGSVLSTDMVVPSTTGESS